MQDDGDGEAVIDGGVLDVGRRHTCLFESSRAGPRGAGIAQVEASTHLVFSGFTAAKYPDEWSVEGLGNLRAGNDNCAAAVAHDAGVETPQGVRNHRRCQYIFDRDHFAQHRQRVVLRMMRGGDLDPRQLLAGCAVLMHMAHRTHGIEVQRDWVIGHLEWRVR
ncbi:hypothetical protein D3C75_934090 [compost metagenome]